MMCSGVCDRAQCFQQVPLLGQPGALGQIPTGGVASD